MRTHSQSATDFPGTVVHGAQGHCAGCRVRQKRGLAGPAGAPREPGSKDAPQAWHVDHAVVYLAVHGEPVQLRPGDRAVAVKQLTALGRSAREIALMLRCTPRTVTRIRNRHTRLQDVA